MRKLTEENIKKNTYWSNRVYDDIQVNIERYKDDSDNNIRILRARECKSCYYLKGDRVVTNAFTTYECKNCESVHTHHNGGVPRYCFDCSDENGVCVRCGGEL